MSSRRQTIPVSDSLFQRVYDSPASLPGRYAWQTSDHDVRELERLLGMPGDTIGAPLWLSGDNKECPTCGRTISWLDIVSSALEGVHARKMIAQVILGAQKYVNTEAPRAIAGVKCSNCGTPIKNIRSFKCHNWAYARPAMLEVLQQVERSSR